MSSSSQAPPPPPSTPALRSALRRPSRPQSPTAQQLPLPTPTPTTTTPTLPHAGIVNSSAFDEVLSASSSNPPITPAMPSPSPSHSSTASSTSVLSTASTSSSSKIINKHGYTRRVAFDTMPDAASSPSHDFSFTLQVKSKGYRRTRNTRTFMCAADGNSYSTHALEWLLDNLVEDGDEVVALRVLDAANSADPGSEASDSDEDAHDEKRLEEYREEANELLRSIEDLNDEMGGDRRISIVVEFVSADPRRRTLTTSITATVVRLIHMYRPDSITIGTRGKNATLMQKMMMGAGFSNSVVVGSVSREILSRSPVPVIVVRPENKVEKHLKKRQADPKRRSYHDLMAKSLHHHQPHHQHQHPSTTSSKRTTSVSSVNSSSSAGSGFLAPPPPPPPASATLKTGQVTVASPLSSSFGPEVSKGEESEKGSKLSSSSGKTSSHTTLHTSTSDSSTSSSTSSTSASTSSSSSVPEPPSAAAASTPETDTTPADKKESSAAAIAKRKPSLKVFEREQHPAGQESPRSPTTHTSKSFASIVSTLASSSSSSSFNSSSHLDSADSSFAAEEGSSTTTSGAGADGSVNVRARTLFQEPIAEEDPR